jgi:hypothetical protein
MKSILLLNSLNKCTSFVFAKHCKAEAYCTQGDAKNISAILTPAGGLIAQPDTAITA